MIHDLEPTLVQDDADTWLNPRFEDQLTGLGNREALNAASTDPDAGERSVVLIDIDQFRAVNDTYGHVQGDAVLRVIASRIQALLGGRQLSVRLGGDEFAIVLAGADRDDCEALAHAVYDAIRQPVEVNGSTLYLDAGVGVALASGELTLWELVSRAGIAIHQLKHSGRLPRVVVFEEPAHGWLLDRFALSLDLRGALTRSQLVLEYQPIVDMATREPVGFEALVRWEHPARGLIAPLRFIPFAEAGGLMPELGEWVLAQACRQARTWSERCDRPIYLSVNISIRQLEDPDFIERFKRVLAGSGLEPGLLRIELTESVIAADGVAAVAPLLAEIREMGVCVLLDDFGTGYSSLGYLRELPLDGVKLDRLFTRELTISTGALTLVRSVVALLSQLGLEIIAEGVDTAAHLAQLRSLGCHLGQGFYFAKPGPPDALRFERPERLSTS